MEGESDKYPGVGPFILGMYLAGVKSGESAERILSEMGSELTEEERRYLEHVVDEGRRCRRIYRRLLALWRDSRRR